MYIRMYHIHLGVHVARRLETGLSKQRKQYGKATLFSLFFNPYSITHIILYGKHNGVKLATYCTGMTDPALGQLRL